MKRTFAHRTLWRTTPDAYRAATGLLAATALLRLGAVPLIVGIGNGGRAPAYVIAARTGAPVIIVTAKHNTSDAIGLQATGDVACDLTPLQTLGRGEPLPGPVLLVDDICGSGSTLSVVSEHLRPLLQPRTVICTATLCRNAGAGAGLPDLYVWDVDDWVVFPWEPLPPGRPTSLLPAPRQVHTT